MASTLQKLLIPIFGYCNLSIPFLKHFTEDPPHKQKHLVVLNQYSLIFHTLLMQRLQFVPITLQVTLTFTLWNGVLLFQQTLHNHRARLLQLCKVANTLHKLSQPYHNLTKLQQGCYNLVNSVWVSRPCTYYYSNVH